jgi:RNA polymerase sigma-70 factor (ECF subfamily)
MDARRAAEMAVRSSYGRLVAYLASRTRDVAAAEDALGDALLIALKTWPETGVPKNPEAWLMVSARNRLTDTARRDHVYENILETLKSNSLRSQPESPNPSEIFPDDRLKLLFICAHPAIDATMHTPLMLQTVLGLNAAQIASAFLVASATMNQRLVRAKAKIRDAGIAFELPEVDELPSRLAAVLEAIYAAYTNAWETVNGSDPRHRGLAKEAIWLARLCVQLMPQAPEARGLLALMLYCEARRDARRSANGAYIPLTQQDTRLWSQPMIDEAESELAHAATLKQLGRFQLEAAIQSLHTQRAITQQVDWKTLVVLYEGLIQLSPTLGAFVSYAAAITEAKRLEQGLIYLNTLPTEAVKNYQPYWALKAHL